MSRLGRAFLAFHALTIAARARVLPTTSNNTSIQQLVNVGGDLESTTTLLVTSGNKTTDPRQTASWQASSEWGSCYDSLCNPYEVGTIPIHIYDDTIKIVGSWRPQQAICVDMCDMRFPIPVTGPPKLVEIHNSEFNYKTAVSKATAYSAGTYEIEMDVHHLSLDTLLVEAKGYFGKFAVNVAAKIDFYTHVGISTQSTNVSALIAASAAGSMQPSR